MATIDLSAPADSASHPRGRGILASLTGYFRRLQDRFEQRRTIVKLSRMDARLLRDMGFEPSAIHSALEGSWDEVPGGCFRCFDRD